MATPTHDLTETYLHLDGDGRAPAVEAGEAFWMQLMTGAFTDPKVEAIAAGGWLVSRFVHGGDWPHWEMHPEGDEVLTCLEGALTFVLEHPGGAHEEVRLTAGRTLVMPAGVWHRGLGRGPATVLAITAGKGTQHRPA